MALPYLEIMLPSKAYAAGESTQKFLGVYFGNGVMMRGDPNTIYNNWQCAGSETAWTLSRALQPLLPYKNMLNVIHGMPNDGLRGAMALDGGTAHWGSASSFLTGQSYDALNHTTKLLKPGMSLDQMIGNLSPTKFKSLVLGNYYTTEHSGDNRGAAEVLNQMSWKSQSEQVPRLTTSKAVFDQLFSSGAPSVDPTVIRRNQMKISIMDAVKEDAKRLMLSLGSADKQRLQNYFDSVNEAEKRIVLENSSQAPLVMPPAGGSYQTDKNAFDANAILQRSKNMMDMIVIALQTDMTRSISFMIDNEHTDVPVAALGGTGIRNLACHTASHYMDSPTDYVPVKEFIGRWQASQMAYLLDKLQATKDPLNAGSLLDNSVVLYGTGISDSHSHQSDNTPIVLAGKGAGLISGRLLQYPNVPYSNLLATIAGRFNLPAKIGLSSGTISGLFS